MKTVTAPRSPAYYPETLGNPGAIRGNGTTRSAEFKHIASAPAARNKAGGARTHHVDSRDRGNAELPLSALLGLGGSATKRRNPVYVLAAGPASPPKSPDALSPEEKMQRRYPQPVKVGDLIGLPVLDSTTARSVRQERGADGERRRSS